LYGSPGVASDHRDATERIDNCWRRSVLDLHDTLDARYLQGLGGSKLATLAAVHGATPRRR